MLAVGGPDALDRPRLDDDLEHLGAGDQLGPGTLGGERERRDEAARVDGGLVRGEDPGDDARAQARLEVAALRSPKPRRLEAERVHQVEAAAQRLGLVAVEGDVKGAEAEEAGVAPAGIGEVAREPRPELVRTKREGEQRVLAVGRLADRREHAGGDA